MLVALLAVVVFQEWPDYRRRDAYTNLKGGAVNSNPEFIEVRTFIRRVTPPTAVFLASHGAGITMVGPAGQKTVAMQPHFSNPYVDYETRARDRDDMFRQLANGELDDFYGIAKRMALLT